MTTETIRLNGRVAVVTGGGSGMGEAISLLFAHEGASVIVADASPSSSSRVVNRILAEGGKAIAVTVDVADELQVMRMVETALSTFAVIDILINCAAIGEFVCSEEITSEKWRRMIDIDLSGVFYCCREVGKAMIKKKYGKIVNFGSTAGLTGVPYMAHYTAAKHGVVGLTKALAAEWGKYNINVNCICPGATLTPMLMTATTPEYRAERAERIPLNRLATPEEQADVALFLASSASGYVTGNVISTDGGIFALSASATNSALKGESFRKI
jgi:3-oxoacyl-[acyl-carrier protein] reductase